MRLKLYSKFLLLVIPVFTVFAGIGVYFLGNMDVSGDSERLALRVGVLGGRLAVALGRAEIQHEDVVAIDLLGTLGTDHAVLCAEVSGEDRSAWVYPPIIGCRGVAGGKSVTFPMGMSGEVLLIVYSDSEIFETARRQTAMTIGIVFCAFAATLASASLGFRFIVGNRLARLHHALHQSASQPSRVQVTAGGSDELGDIINAYNSLMMSEQEREFHLWNHNEQLKDASLRDPLTGLYNRRYFEAWMKDYKRHSSLSQLTGVMGLIDVDYFKSINDVFGHSAGDEVLVTLAQRLLSATRADDFLVRWGGEELLIYVADPRNMEAIARRTLSCATHQDICTAAGNIRITASMGLVKLPLLAGDYYLSIERSISFADSALYVAKHSGRNRAVCLHALRVQGPHDLDELEFVLDEHLAEYTTVLPDDRVARRQGTST